MKHRVRRVRIIAGRTIQVSEFEPEVVVEVRAEDRWQDDGGAVVGAGTAPISGRIPEKNRCNLRQSQSSSSSGPEQNS